ncbi:MAG TPA: branched-chain amino acid ABC transporter permease [Acidimicrobiales bacterium]|nr:branched-chain amino acid ABC transporter permease [Acidimicrobiales bacterium]
MTELLQNLVDGLGRGSIYALIALGIAVIFGVMHLVNFAHGELITVSAYVAYWMLTSEIAEWWLVVPAVFLTAIITSVVIEFVAFRWVRGAPDFTMLLTSFGVHFVVQALFVMFVSANLRQFPRPGWIFDTWKIFGVSFEVVDVLTIVVTAVTLVATVLLLKRTMFGIALRAAAEDFDAARLMGVRSDRVIRGAFALAGALAGVAAVFWLMRTGQAEPSAGITPMLKGVLAAIIGGLGSLGGAVLGGLALGLAEVLLRTWLPESVVGLTDGFVFVLIALLFIFRPQGFIAVRKAERV